MPVNFTLASPHLKTYLVSQSFCLDILKNTDKVPRGADASNGAIYRAALGGRDTMPQAPGMPDAPGTVFVYHQFAINRISPMRRITLVLLDGTFYAVLCVEDPKPIGGNPADDWPPVLINAISKRKAFDFSMRPDQPPALAPINGEHVGRGAQMHPHEMEPSSGNYNYVETADVLVDENGYVGPGPANPYVGPGPANPYGIPIPKRP